MHEEIIFNGINMIETSGDALQNANELVPNKNYIMNIVD